MTRAGRLDAFACLASALGDMPPWWRPLARRRWKRLRRTFEAVARYAFHDEFDAMNRAMDAREAEIDAHGYGRKPGTPLADVIGLHDFIPWRRK